MRDLGHRIQSHFRSPIIQMQTQMRMQMPECKCNMQEDYATMIMTRRTFPHMPYASRIATRLLHMFPALINRRFDTPTEETRLTPVQRVCHHATCEVMAEWSIVSVPSVSPKIPRFRGTRTPSFLRSKGGDNGALAGTS